MGASNQTRKNLAGGIGVSQENWLPQVMVRSGRLRRICPSEKLITLSRHGADPSDE